MGPNITGYPGGYPNGYLAWLKKAGYWGEKRLHLCSGSVKDGVTIDINPQTRPTIRADLSRGTPLRDESFNVVIIDPPYSEEMANDLYAVPLLSVRDLLKEASRVCVHDGYVVLLDLRVWPPPKSLDWVELSALYMANRGAKPLRAIQVWRKKPKPLSDYESIVNQTEEVRLHAKEKVHQWPHREPARAH